MATGYSLPPWLTPSESSPFQALIAGAQVGRNIAANRQAARQLAAQTQHQAFQDRVLNEKFQADAQDLKTLQEWWPTFTSAEGDALRTLTVPPLKNAQMWNRISMEVERKKQQAAASDFANALSGLDLSNPADQAIAWGKAAALPPQALDMLGRRIDHAVTAKQRQAEAAALAGYRDRMASVAEDKLLLDMAGDEAMEPEVKIVDGERVIRLGPNRWQYLGQEFETDKLPASVRKSIYADQLKEVDEELEFLPGSTSPRFTPEIQKQRTALESKRDAIRAKRDAMVGETAAAPAPAESTKKLYFNPETGQLQDTPYAPKR